MGDCSGSRVYGQFSVTYPPIMDGVASVVRNYAVGLAARGDLCYVITPRAGGRRKADEEANAAHVLRCASIPRPNAKPYMVPVMGPLFRAALRRIRFDLIHAHYPILMGNFAVRLARQQGIPVVATFHTRYREQIRRAVRWRWPADRIASVTTRFYARADEVWVPSAGALRVLKDYGYTRDNIRVMEQGTDFDIPTEEEYSAYRAAGLRMAFSGSVPDHRPPVLIYVGNMITTKNVDLILGALSGLRATGRGFRMLFVGDGYYRAAMERRALREGFGDQVLFFGSVSDRRRIGSLLAASDLFLFPSVADTAGIVRIEAAAFSLPLVVVREECAASGIVDGVNGFLSQNNAGDYARAIVSALNAPAGLRNVGRNARDTLYRGWDELIDEVRAQYERIIREHRNRPALRPDGPGNATG